MIGMCQIIIKYLFKLYLIYSVTILLIDLILQGVVIKHNLTFQQYLIIWNLNNLIS